MKSKTNNPVEKQMKPEDTTEAIKENQPIEENLEQEPGKTDEVVQLKEALASAKDQNLRLYAEFENFKRRNAKERIELISTANLDMMQAILPVVDDFERALKNIAPTEENKALYEGVELIHNKLIDTLKHKGLKPMESTVGMTFDLEKMEAITQIPAANADQHNTVIDEVERGYYLGEKVLRYAKVVVGSFTG